MTSHIADEIAEAQRDTETSHPKKTAESAPVFDRRHRGIVLSFRTRVFVSLARFPGPLCSEHSGSACVVPACALSTLERK